MKLLGELLLDAAQRCRDSAGLVTPGGFTGWATLRDNAFDLATALRDLGIGQGDHVGVLLPNDASFVEALFAIGFAGARPVALNTRYQTHELSFAVEHADLTALITTAPLPGSPVNYPERLEAALPDLAEQSGEKPLALAGAPRLRHILARAGTAAWVRTLPPRSGRPVEPDSGWRDADSEDPALMTYTSGTTSRPKLCMLAHRSVIKTNIGAAIGRIGLVPGDVIWNPAPLFHVSAYVSLVGSLTAGCTYMTASYFDPDMMLQLFARYPVTVAFANFTNFYYSLMDSPSFVPEALARLRIFTVSAVESEIRAIRQSFPQAIQLGLFGATEVSGTACITPPDDDDDARAQTCGQPVDGVEITIHDPETGARLDAGHVGEIWVRGVCLFLGYYREGPIVLTEGDDPGWFRTGDLGRLDDGGRLSFQGRVKDMLKVGGENVSPAEVETFLSSHPAIRTAQLVGQPDQRLGEVPIAFIELRAGQAASEQEILNYCEGRIARYKIPKGIRFVTEWPMSGTKIQKNVLRERLTALEQPPVVG